MAKKKNVVKKAQHGGPRPGGGRPKLYGDRVCWTVWIDKDVAAACEAWREKRELSQSQLVERALERLTREKGN